MFVKKLFRLRIWSPRHKYENKIKTENSKSNIPGNVMVKTVNTTSVSDVRLGVMNVSSLGNTMYSGYTLHHRPRNTGRKGGDVGVLINNRIKHQSRILHDKPKITSLNPLNLS